MFKKIFIINLTVLFLSTYLNANIQIKARTAILQDFLSGEILYKQIAVFEGGIINVAGMKQVENKQDKVVDILPKVAE